MASIEEYDVPAIDKAESLGYSLASVEGQVSIIFYLKFVDGVSDSAHVECGARA